MPSKQTVLWILILIALLILITLPRFNRNDMGVGSLTEVGGNYLGDADEYMAVTSYFRGEAEVDDVRPPFSYRPFAPFLAAQLPFEAMTALNLINLAAMIIALNFMYGILKGLDLDFNLCIVGCGLFVLSFPTFYYTTIGMIDPMVILFLTMGLFFIFNNEWLFLAVVIVTGVLVKESVILLILTLAAYLFFRRQLNIKQGLFLLAMLLLFALGQLFARRIIPVNPSVVWPPSLEMLLKNISRPRSWLAFLLSFGIPGAIALLIFFYRKSQWFHERHAETATLIAGTVFTLFLFGYSLFSAWADGRIIWLSTPFTVPLAAIVLSEMRDGRLFNKRRVY